jgi:hypothetical protein
VLPAAERFGNGYQAIEYPHVQRRQVIKPADVTFKIRRRQEPAQHQRRLHRRGWRSSAGSAASNSARK